MRKAIAVLGVIASLAFYGDVTCPIDNQQMYFTGKTMAEGGKLLKEYKCPMGHTAWEVD